MICCVFPLEYINIGVPECERAGHHWVLVLEPEVQVCHLLRHQRARSPADPVGDVREQRLAEQGRVIRSRRLCTDKHIKAMKYSFACEK